jgi:hypothetical protein
MRLQPESFSITGTHNIDHILTNHTQSLLLPDGRYDFFKSIAPDDCDEKLGDPTVSTYEDFDGYGDEWYFKAPSGNTVAIGFRWDIPRLRGDARTTVGDVIDFVDYLKSQLTET